MQLEFAFLYHLSSPSTRKPGPGSDLFILRFSGLGSILLLNIDRTAKNLWSGLKFGLTGSTISASSASSSLPLPTPPCSPSSAPPSCPSRPPAPPSSCAGGAGVSPSSLAGTAGPGSSSVPAACAAPLCHGVHHLITILGTVVAFHSFRKICQGHTTGVFIPHYRPWVNRKTRGAWGIISKHLIIFEKKPRE